MARKVSILLAIVVLFGGLAATANAASVYDGTMSTTYVTYFRDILAFMDFGDDYVAYRSGQNEYQLVVGKLEYENNAFSGSGMLYTITTDSGYNGGYSYSVVNVDNFSLDVGDNMVYSNLGDFPHLINLGEHYEVLQTIIMWVALLCLLIRPIFRNR